MASAVRASIYAHMEINKNGKVADIKGKTVSFDYYESVYSPVITAKLIFTDAGGSITADKAQDSNERRTNIKDGLPITQGEDVKVQIQSKFGTLNFKRNPLKVESSPIVNQEENRTSVLLNLVSTPEIKNLDSAIHKKYKGRISDTVKKILKDSLGIPRLNIDPTKNSYNFIGKGKSALDIVNDLCRRSIPEKGDPGYFFYETQSGFNFKSIDRLIVEGSKRIKSDSSYRKSHTYKYSGALRSNLDNDSNDFRILLPPTQVRDQNLLDALKEGTYVSRNVFVDPRTFVKTEQIYHIGKDGVSNTLGKMPDFADKVGSYTKTNYHILDIGSLEPDVSINTNNDPRQWQAKSKMRYNLLHSQLVQIQVPCNLRLEAGDVVRCELAFPGDKPEEGSVSQQQSGNYLILHLCHHFDTERSYTSMTLARDTYGLYTK
jgi:hypothetical protein